MTTLWYHGMSTIFLETPVFMFSLLRIFDVIFDKIIDVVERFCFPLWHPWQYLLSKIQKCLNFVPLFLSASIKKEGLIIVSRRNCVIRWSRHTDKTKCTFAYLKRKDFRAYYNGSKWMDAIFHSKYVNFSSILLFLCIWYGDMPVFFEFF